MLKKKNGKCLCFHYYLNFNLLFHGLFKFPISIFPKFSREPNGASMSITQNPLSLTVKTLQWNNTTTKTYYSMTIPQPLAASTAPLATQDPTIAARRALRRRHHDHRHDGHRLRDRDRQRHGGRPGSSAYTTWWKSRSGTVMRTLSAMKRDAWRRNCS